MAISKIENNSLASGVPGRANLPAGTVLQVVNATSTATVSTTSLSFVTTGLSASITPTSATNKILVIANIPTANGSSANGVVYTLFRGTVSGTNLGGSSDGFGNFATGSGGQLYSSYAISYLDSPSTTSAQTYTIGMYARGGTTAYAMLGNAIGSITLMEIAA